MYVIYGECFFYVGKLAIFGRPLALGNREASLANMCVQGFVLPRVGTDLSSLEVPLYDVYSILIYCNPRDGCWLLSPHGLIYIDFPRLSSSTYSSR